MALISFLKIIAQIKKSRKLLKYKENKELNERIPNYQVKMGFGLHVGWAIEGNIRLTTDSFISLSSMPY